VGNDPLSERDPDGETGLVGALVGGGLDILVQTAEIALDDDKTIDDFSVKSVLVSSAAGAIGAGLISKIDRVGKIGSKVAGVVGDAAVAAGSRLAKGEKVTAAGVAADVTGGRALGAAGSQLGRRIGPARVQGRDAHRLETRSRDSRLSAKQKERARIVAAAARARQGASIARAGAIGSGVGGSAGENLEKCARNDGVCKK
jgi:hypothetical protein